MPILRIKNKHIRGEIVKLFIFRAINEKILQNKKKIKE
tara:strand:+ start:292 stop:405 length:114 start_codon:yes stop_codon:yes gene_type:complete